MRLRSLEVSGFRAFAKELVLDLDADAIVVVGPNGQGKTSLFDAIFWAVAGAVPRLGDAGSVVSLFSASGEARVALELVSQERGGVRIVRSSDGSHSMLSLDLDGQTLRGPEATSRIFRMLWPQALRAASPDDALISSLERGVYLQQDRVRDFIEAQSDQDRFTTISELIGAGRINELQVALDRSRRAWSQVTNTQAREADEIRSRIDDLRTQMARLGSDTEAEIDAEQWRRWWERGAQLDVGASPPPSLEAPDAAVRLDAAVKEISARREAYSRRGQGAVYLDTALRDLPTPPTDDIEALREQAEVAQRAAEEARVGLTAAELRAAEIRRLQVEAAEARQQLQALAQLALNHLGDRCPVCDQDYDREATHRRLATLASSAADSVPDVAQSEDVPAAATLVQANEQTAIAATNALAAAEARARDWSARRGDLDARARKFGLAPDAFDSWRKEIAAVMGQSSERIQQLDELAREGEELALSLARAGQRARRVEIDREIHSLHQALSTAQLEVSARERTTGVVAELIEALRTASADVVEAELERIEPLLQRIYATADPHPAFRVVRLLSRMRQGRGRIVSQLEDPIRDVPSESPGTVLSSSQMNVLAVSIFLALNLGMPRLPMDAAILDDPLQSLDDLNLLGLTDLLRRTRERRQLIVSTHDLRFAGLLERKLRPVREGQRTLVLSLDAWRPDGVEVSTREITREVDPVRIAA